MAKINKVVKVLIVDDSGLIRKILAEILESSPKIEVVGAAKDPYEARELIKQLNPDVLTLDIEMPRMNGITFLKNLMRLRPMPVVMISTLTSEGAPATLEALEIGAVDFLPKPDGQTPTGLTAYSEVIIEKVLAAASANLHSTVDNTASNIVKVKEDLPKGRLINNLICAIGASTGGTEAIKEVLTRMPKEVPPIVVTQHIPGSFSASFAKRLDGFCTINVCEAQHNQVIETGCAYIAPGDSHLRLAKMGQQIVCRLDDGEPVNRHRPSVEVLFDSVNQLSNIEVIAVLLTGMGADGAEALLRLRQEGFLTIAQDEASSVVWGMPGAAVKIDAAMEVLPLNKITHRVLEASYR